TSWPVTGCPTRELCRSALSCWPRLLCCSEPGPCSRVGGPESLAVVGAVADLCSRWASTVAGAEPLPPFVEGCDALDAHLVDRQTLPGSTSWPAWSSSPPVRRSRGPAGRSDTHTPG